MKDSVFTDNQTTSANPLPAPKAVPYTQQLTLNILPFEHPVRSMEFTFTDNENACKHRFWIKKLPFEAHLHFSFPDPQKPFVYTNFDTVSEGSPVLIDFSKQKAVARAWYTLKISDFLRQSANVTVTNFLNDCQFWYIEKDMNNSLYDIYKKFTVRVQNDYHSGKPELLISFDGKSYVLKKNLAQLTEKASFDPQRLKVIFQKQVYKYKFLPDEALYHPDEIYPVISWTNMNALQVKLPTGMNPKKHLSTHAEIETFFNTYLNTDEFRTIIPHQGKWKTAGPADVNRLAQTSREMIFGEEKTGIEVYGGIKANGPYRLPSYRHTKIFMIYQANDLATTQKLKEYIAQKSGFGSLGAFTRMQLEHDSSLDIVLNGDRNPAEAIRETISHLSIDHECGYFAFYISPYTRFETDPLKHGIYYKLKENLLQRGIGLQVIERDTISGNFAMSIANIGIAMIAKMGGIPWRLSNTGEKELIIGFGAFNSRRYNTRYIGSAFCFSNDGTFQEFNCFPADETWSIAALVEEALIAYREKNKDVKRIVIHFYQKIGRRQLKPIEDMLRRLHFDIPVIVVRINKTFSGSQLAFDETFAGKMPLNGSYVQIGHQEYLFCNNQRDTDGSSPASLPLPIKIGLQSDREDMLADPALVERLMMQVYEFSFMHWRSVKQQNLPVTVTYPEMLARIFSGFDRSVLPDKGLKSLFFL